MLKLKFPDGSDIFYSKKADFEESLVIDQDFTIVIYNFKAVVEKSLNLNKKR